MLCIEARGLRKTFGSTVAVDGMELQVEEGRILGLIGPNGAGKTTALKAILGLTPFEGELHVLGRDPWNERDELMRDVSFIADVAVLPRWMRVTQALDYVAGVHPRFDRAKAEGFLAKTAIKSASRVKELSKGMVTQLHLALVMAIDAKLLVLDEPTLGLDILFRKQFYDSLLNDYFDHHCTIVVTTHHPEEIQHVITDVMFVDRGRVVLNCSMDDFESSYQWSIRKPRGGARAKTDPRTPGVRPQHLPLRPIRRRLRPWASVPPQHADLFVAVIGNQMANAGTPHEHSIECRPRASLAAARAPARPFFGRCGASSRSLYLVPLIAAGVALIVPGAATPRKTPATRPRSIEREVRAADGLARHRRPLILVTVVTGAFYCLGRSASGDRSILF
jgi:ABC-2 type transport system ATP-binding protein